MRPLHKFRLVASSVLLAAVILILSNCGKTSTPASGTFASVYSSIQTANCAQCHKPGGSATANSHTALDFSSQATAYTTLTGSAKVVGDGASGTCGNVLLVDSSAAQSYFAFAFLGATDPTAYGTASFTKQPGCTVFPVSGHNVQLTADEEKSIVAWIAAGAPNN